MSEITTNSQGVESVMTHITDIKLIMLIYFCSGLCSLIDELMWVCLLKLTLEAVIMA